MPIHLQREIDNLKKEILNLSAMAEMSVREAVTSIQERDGTLAKHIIESDARIDRKEVEVEETCLKILALYQPVATDLRFIVAVLKINNDLERIADLAVNIAERAVYIATQPEVDLAFDFPGMASKAETMLKESLDALVNLDADLAYKVWADDDAVDDMNRQAYAQIQDALHKHPDQTECLIHLLSVSRHLERIADGATNIAEDVIYMVRGEIVRHKVEEYKSRKHNN
jgi:phosphate transport system protein